VNRIALAASVGLAIAAVATAEIYKWVDEKGVTHYSEHPPAHGAAKTIETPPAPVPGAPAAPGRGEKEEALQKRRAEAGQREPKPAPSAQGDPAARNAPWLAGKYLTTVRTWTTYAMHGEILSGRLGLTVVGNSALEGEAWLRAELMVPMHTRDSAMIANPAPPLQLLLIPEQGLLRIHPGGHVTIETPELEHLRCVPYPATIALYRDPRGDEPLDVHRQRIYARIDGSKVRSDSELAAALASGKECAP
jgi:hypothetical protein